MALDNVQDVLGPGDSASNFAANDSMVGSLIPELSKCVFTAGDYLRLVELLGVGEANAMRDFMANQLATVKQCLSVGAYNARVSSVGSRLSFNSRSGSSPSLESAAVGLHGARMVQVGKRSRRAKKVPDGLCYTKLFSDDNVACQAELLGKWPTMASLLKKPASIFQSVGELGRFRIVGDSGSVHVKAGGVDGQSFVASAAFLASSVRQAPGSFGALVKSLGASSKLPFRVSLGTVVGGKVVKYCQVCRRGFPSVESFTAHCSESERHLGGDGRHYAGWQQLTLSYVNEQLKELGCPGVKGVWNGTVGCLDEFRTNAVGSSKCVKCANVWRSFAIPVTFSRFSGGVSVYVWEQECRRCRGKGVPDLDFGDLAGKLVRRVRIWRGEKLPRVAFGDSAVTKPHEKEYCVASRSGKCVVCNGAVGDDDALVSSLARVAL